MNRKLFVVAGAVLTVLGAQTAIADEATAHAGYTHTSRYIRSAAPTHGTRHYATPRQTSRYVHETVHHRRYRPHRGYLHRSFVAQRFSDRHRHDHHCDHRGIRYIAPHRYGRHDGHAGYRYDYDGRGYDDNAARERSRRHHRND